MDEQQNKLKIAQQNLLGTIPGNKRDVNRIAGMTVTAVLDGDENPLEVDVKLRYLEHLIKSIRENLEMKDAVLQEAHKYGEKTFQAFGVEITKTTVGTRYDYSQCGDSTHTDILAKIAELTEHRKEREKLLQGLDGEMAIPETGEIIYPPAKKSSEGLRVKLL